MKKQRCLFKMICVTIIDIVLSSPLGAWGPDTDISSVSASFWGEQPSDFSGQSVSYAGDVNGDGYDDFLIDARYNDDGGDAAGQVYLILGKPAGWSMDTDLSSADASFLGENAGDYAGFSVSYAGDVNGDGYDDFLIGTYRNDEGGNDAGQVYLILGKSSGWVMDTDLSSADASFWGESAGDQAGFSMSFAGDVNGDGYDDFVIGTTGDDDGGTNAGQTYLLLGKASGWSMDTNLSFADASFIGEEQGDYAGHSLSSAGDVNGDGFADFLISAHYNDDGGINAGKVYLIFGKSSGWSMDKDLSSADASFIGEEEWDMAGSSCSSAGDVNGDGYDDFIIGAYGNDEGGDYAGQVYLVLGKSSSWSNGTDLSSAVASFIGENENDYAGWAVSSAGDVDGDGYNDFLIGAYNNDEGGNNSGQVYLILGKSASWSMDTDLSAVNASFLGEDDIDQAGKSLSLAGDVNGDGFEDFIIGAPFDEEGGTSAGQTYLVLSDQSGSTNGTYKNYIGSGDTPPSNFENANVTLDFSTASSSSAYIAVTEHNNQKPPGLADEVFNRYWTMVGSGLSNYSFSLKFKYNDNEIAEAGGTEGDLKIAYKNGDNWTIVSTTVDALHNKVTATGLAHFSDWAIGSEAGFVSVDDTPPAAITDLAINSVTATSVALSWTAPGDDGAAGIATTYDVRYSSSTITEGNWGSANQATGEPSPQTSGSSESFTVTGLSKNNTYYFAIKSGDEIPNWSDLSNGVNVEIDGTPPVAVIDLSISSVTATSVALSWTAPGDDGTIGTATTYDVRYSTSTITAGNWDLADQAATEPSPQSSGSSESFTITGLAQNTTYYFGIKTTDELDNYSDL